MSATRRAEPDATFRQERFASSATLERGLMGNLVAKRCEALEDARQRDLIWFLQFQSHAPGGVAMFCREFIAHYPDRLGTPTMHRVGDKAGKPYTAAVTQQILDELEPDKMSLRLKRRRDREMTAISRQLREMREDDHALRPVLEKEDALPAPRARDEFLHDCRAAAGGNLEELLTCLCLDPALNLETAAVPWFADIIGALLEFQHQYEDRAVRAGVITEIGRLVNDTLDYCLQARCMVLINGLARTGKTHAAKAWCEARPGRARYVQVPSSSDDIGFFRAIARAVGVSINQNSKAQQLRDRIEDTLRSGHLALVVDEAHFCFPQSNYRDALPGRINWILTALVNQGVPVALVTTPQFIRAQKTVEQKSGWTSEQFIGRVGHYQPLPDCLGKSDLEAVAKSLLPEGCGKSIETLVVYAQSSAKYLAAIESAIRRARFLAAKAGREKVIFPDVREAIKTSVIPSDSALAVALAEAPRPRRRREHIAAPARHSRTIIAPDAPAAPDASQDKDFATNRAATSNDLLAGPMAA